MRSRAFTIAVLLAAGLVIGAAALVTVLRSRRASEVETPAHFFLPHHAHDGGELRCQLARPHEKLDALWRQPLQPCTLGNGWLAPNRGGAWAMGAAPSRAVFNLESTDWSRLSIKARAQPNPDAGAQQAALVRVNGRPIGDIPIAATTGRGEVEIPDGALVVGANTIDFDFRYRVSQKQAGIGKNPKRLAAQFREISLRRDGVGLSERRSSGGQVFNRRRARFVIAEPGTLVLPFEPSAAARSLELEMLVSEELDRQRSRLVMKLEDVDGVNTRSLVLPLGDDRFDRGSGRLGGGIGLESFAGAACLLSIEVDPQPAGAFIEIRPPRILEKSVPATAPGAEPSRVGQPPDIVLITLDAARSDRFSCYGHDRPTSPFIDRFAARSIVFSNAFALAPYTLCSVPTMITGLSFFDHGVVTHDDTLSPTAVTMAERLRAADYRTVCFSATPNNSRAKGFDQGYDEFFELWKDAPSKETSRKAHYVTSRVVRWLEANDDGRPLHLQVHYVPPHGPYAPRPKFDVFTDPDYRGGVKGTHKYLEAIDGGSLEPSEADLRHLMDLYDGILLEADDAVGWLLAVLRQRPAWRNTVVLLTSDHGEAFFEHGRMEHNSTLYDEMLRIPFILRLPDGSSRAGIDTERLVTLADIVPTLLGTASIEAPGPMEGIDVLEGLDAGERPPARFFIARNTSEPPLLGLGSLRWKSLLSWSGIGALYDLEADPSETTDLAFERPELFVGLSQLLTIRATRPPQIVPWEATAEITDQDREMLEALGYVQ